jgi:hypothetical protein
LLLRELKISNSCGSLLCCASALFSLCRLLRHNGLHYRTCRIVELTWAALGGRDSAGAGTAGA